MRVIAGNARGIRLSAPQTPGVRPTLDRVREALFSILGDRIHGCRFLDLFAGSGANGIEALSRGATFSVFVDSDPQVIDCIKDNLERTRLIERARCICLRLPEQINRIRSEQPFSIIFADPPRVFSDWAPLLEEIRRARLVAPDAIVVLEHGATLAPPVTVAGFTQFDSRAYGKTLLAFFR